MQNNQNFEKSLPASDTFAQKNLRRSIIFRKNKPRIVFISPQVIGAKNQLRKCTPPLGISSLAAVLERENSMNFARNLDADSFSVSFASPLPGPPMRDIVGKDNLFYLILMLAEWYLLFLVLNLKDISPDELYDYIEKLIKS